MDIHTQLHICIFRLGFLGWWRWLRRNFLIFPSYALLFLSLLRVFDFNTNFTFYNQINWSRCRRITRDAVDRERERQRDMAQRGRCWKGVGGFCVARGVACHWLHLTVRRSGARETRDALLIYANIDRANRLWANRKAVKLVPRFLLLCFLPEFLNISFRSICAT